jgi:hypothetical protein
MRVLRVIATTHYPYMLSSSNVNQMGGTVRILKFNYRRKQLAPERDMNAASGGASHGCYLPLRFPPLTRKEGTSTVGGPLCRT